MIDLDVLIAEIPGLTGADLARWIANDWVRPDGGQGAWLFQEIDVARVRLICELRFDLRIDEEALPVVLLLLDQLYRMRRQVLALGVALERLPAADTSHSGGQGL